MRLRKITLKDRKLFERFFSLAPHQLSVYSFQNIYIWKGLFDIEWAIVKDNLCVFFKDKFGCFLYLPPMGEQKKPKVVEESFQIMDQFNRNKEVSRIENIEAEDLGFYRNLGYQCQNKYPEYLCKSIELTQLKGDKFKSKRASFNYFVKNYNFEYSLFSPRDKNQCLKLYDNWARERKILNKDSVYQGMLGDTRACFKTLLQDYRYLNAMGRVVRLDREIKAFTFGFRLNSDVFCVLFEITDLSIKGLAQFIFRKFCSELKDYKYINIMDDSGLENLKITKLSYHPVKSVPVYIVSRKNAQKLG